MMRTFLSVLIISLFLFSSCSDDKDNMYPVVDMSGDDSFRCFYML
jgi:hypothetical protein